jgi:class 3 adenylate cyclase/pimeloyl-ACP methyl ester carboxylesterase
MRPETRYTSVGDDQVAYQCFGDGNVDLVVMFTSIPVDVVWESRYWRRFLERLATFSRVIMFDRRGFGSSDHIRLESLPRWEAWAEDLTAVLDATGSERASVFATGDMGLWGLLLAATNPQRVQALILWNAYARTHAAPDYPIGSPPEATEAIVEYVTRLWGTPEGIRFAEPALADDPAEVDFLARLARLACPPSFYAAYLRYIGQFDARGVLDAIHVPVLVLANDYETIPAAHGRYVADHVEGARFAKLPGRGLCGVYDCAHQLADHIEEFVTGVRPAIRVDRVLATVLFTDLVGSTERASEMGDRRWKELLDTHDMTVRRLVDEGGGRVIKSTGDGVLATFDGPGRALSCAAQLRNELSDLGLQIYAGLHTGEIELRGDDIGGVAVNLASRIMTVAKPGDIICSRTVKDLVVGSGIQFDDRGTHALKGVPDEWQLYAVVV